MHKTQFHSPIEKEKLRQSKVILSCQMFDLKYKCLMLSSKVETVYL